MIDAAKTTGTPRTLDVRPHLSEASKPSELIQIKGHQRLSLNARRAITLLWHNAHRQGIRAGQDYVIEIDDLKPDGHKGYEMVDEAIMALMRTILTVRLPDGGTRRVQLLGGNDIDDPFRESGVLHYSFDKRVISILENSTIWCKIDLPIIMILTSRYTISLYENIAQLAGLTRKCSQAFSLQEFRDVLGVENEKYQSFGALNKHIIKPAVQEINALASFTITLVPEKTGKKVTTIHIKWRTKTDEEIREAWREVDRPRVGRKARIAGLAEQVLPPAPSQNRLMRRARQESRRFKNDTELPPKA